MPLHVCQQAAQCQPPAPGRQTTAAWDGTGRGTHPCGDGEPHPDVLVIPPLGPSQEVCDGLVLLLILNGGQVASLAFALGLGGGRDREQRLPHWVFPHVESCSPPCSPFNLPKSCQASSSVDLRRGFRGPGGWWHGQCATPPGCRTLSPAGMSSRYQDRGRRQAHPASTAGDPGLSGAPCLQYVTRLTFRSPRKLLLSPGVNR